MNRSAEFSRHDGQPASAGVKIPQAFARAIFLFFISFFFSQISQAGIVLQIDGGTSHSFDTTLKVGQSGKPPLEFSANYETHPWRSAPYYAIRIGKWNQKSGWEIELIHHKLYLNNPQPPIDSFRITNGYSMLLVDYAREYHGFLIRAGGGALIAYPITSIDGIVTSGGYRLSGVAAQGAIEKRFFFGKNIFLCVEGKLTLARAKLTLKNAKATVPNVALHGLFGIGYAF